MDFVRMPIIWIVRRNYAISFICYNLRASLHLGKRNMVTNAKCVDRSAPVAYIRLYGMVWCVHKLCASRIYWTILIWSHKVFYRNSLCRRRPVNESRAIAHCVRCAQFHYLFTLHVHTGWWCRRRYCLQWKPISPIFIKYNFFFSLCALHVSSLPLSFHSFCLFWK